MHLSGIITRLLELNLPFVCYRLPAARKPVLLSGGEFEQLASPLEASGRKGFIVVPFDAAARDSVLFFQPQSEHQGWYHDLQFPAAPEGSEWLPEASALPVSVNYDQYAAQAVSMIRAMKQGDLKKVVLSRVIDHSLPDDFQAGTFFRKLCDKYPHAFVSVFNDGKGRCWMGASPEMLLQINHQHGQTVSLAATQPVSVERTAILTWKQKETLEQELVSEYIRKTLAGNHISQVQEGPLETLIAGPVAHLRKSFDFSIPTGYEPLQLAMALHPTPAVCGLPVGKALEMILTTEPHPRSYYSGFLGPVEGTAHTELFVNLRCMQVIGRKGFLYVGGGLLPASDIELEWLETVKKAETLLGMLQK
ncbi:MAG: chorismate-binding protein [Bacteroidales bacterium]